MNIIQPKTAHTPEQMRAAIDELRLDNPVVYAGMKAADITGMSLEDRYTVLAYYALVALTQTQQSHLDDLSRRARFGFV